MIHSTRAFAVAVAVCSTLPAGAAAAELSFPVPAGWLDASPAAVRAEPGRFPAELVRQVESGKYLAFAFDVAHASDGFTPNLNVVGVPQALRIRPSDVDEAAEAILKSIRAELPGARLVEKELVEISGVNALRLVYDTELGGRELRQMAVVVPGVPRSAIVTYSALRSQFDAVRPSFDAHAASITGAEERGGLPGILARAGGAGVVGALGGAIVGAVVLIVRRKRAA